MADEIFLSWESKQVQRINLAGSIWIYYIYRVYPILINITNLKEFLLLPAISFLFASIWQNLETQDPSDIWSEWQKDKKTKRQKYRNYKRQKPEREFDLWSIFQGWFCVVFPTQYPIKRIVLTLAKSKSQKYCETPIFATDYDLCVRLCTS